MKNSFLFKLLCASVLASNVVLADAASEVVVTDKQVTETEVTEEKKAEFPPLTFGAAGGLTSSVYTVFKNAHDQKVGLFNTGIFKLFGLAETADLKVKFTAGLNMDMDPTNMSSNSHMKKASFEMRNKYFVFNAGSDNDILPYNNMGSGYENVLPANNGANQSMIARYHSFPSGITYSDYIVSDAGYANTAALGCTDGAIIDGLRVAVGYTPNTGNVGFAGVSSTVNPVFNQMTKFSALERRNDPGQQVNGQFAPYNFNDVAVDSAGTALANANIKKHNLLDPSYRAFDLNQFSFAANYVYNNDAGDTTLSVSGFVVTGDARPNGDSLGCPKKVKDANGQDVDLDNTLNRTFIWQMGADFTYQAFSIGGTYTDNGKSRVPNKFTKLADGEYDAGRTYGVAVAFKHDVHKIGVGYHGGKRKFGLNADTNVAEETKYNWYSIEYKAQLLKGVTLFAAYNYIDMKTCENAKRIAANTYGTSASGDLIGDMLAVTLKISV